MANVVLSDLSKLLKDSGNAKILEMLVNSEVEKAEKKRSTVADRQAAHLETISEKDLEKLKEMKVTMRTFVDLITRSSFLDWEPGTGQLLNEKEKFDAMKAWLAMKDITEFAEVWRLQARNRVFDHITSEFEVGGEEDPGNKNGNIPVYKLGKKFCKEGTGRKDPVLDEGKLKELLDELDPTIWPRIQNKEIIPAKEIKSLSVEKLMGEVGERPEILQKIGESLVVGEFKTPKMQVRPLTAEERLQGEKK